MLQRHEALHPRPGNPSSCALTATAISPITLWILRSHPFHLSQLRRCRRLPRRSFLGFDGNFSFPKCPSQVQPVQSDFHADIRGYYSLLLYKDNLLLVFQEILTSALDDFDAMIVFMKFTTKSFSYCAV